MASGAVHRVLPSAFGIVAVLLCAMSPASVRAEDRCDGAGEARALEPFETENGMGYRTTSGNVVIPPRFAMAFAFSPECIAAVADTSGWAYIDGTGAVLVRPHVVDNGPDPFHEDRARYVHEGKFGFIDRSARIVIEARFAYAEPFEHGYALVCADCTAISDGEHTRMVGKRWGAIDAQGHFRIEPNFAREAASKQVVRLRNQH